MISEEVICMSLVLGILNYILFALVVSHTIRRYSDPIVKPLDGDNQETESPESSDLPRAA